jgi:hypothetical protein
VSNVTLGALGPSYVTRHTSDVRATDDFEIVTNTGRVVSQVNGKTGLVPALAIPVDTKSVFEFPDNHKGHLVTSIPEVTRLLTIAWRASEHSFLDPCDRHGAVNSIFPRSVIATTTQPRVYNRSIRGSSHCRFHELVRGR